jgi:tetratricopeptide (TPR) repeat protein
MKKILFGKLAILLSLALVISSCSGLKKMKDQASTVKYEATPKVLEMNNGEVSVTISGSYPAKYFNKKAVLTVTPVLKYEGGQQELTPIKLQGESVTANDKPINYAQGGSFSSSDKFTYKDEMMQSQLELKVTAAIKDKSLEIGSFKVADGIIVTPKMVQMNPKSTTLGDKFQRNVAETKEADIKYLINRAEIRSTELKKDEVKNLNAFVKEAAKNPKISLKGIELSSYASPDGSVDLNTKLADSREKSASKFIKDELKKGKVEQAKTDSFFSMLRTPEDWDGFKSLMEKSDIKDKELILRVLSMYSDADVREKEIKNISQAYDEIKEKILPELRRSKFIVKLESIGYSDEELVAFAQSNSDTLNLEELLYTAALSQDNEVKAALYQKASDKYPNDVRAKNNLGWANIQLGKLDDAKAALEAAKMIENNDAVKNNLGVVAILKGDLTGAEELLTSALGAGEAPNYNLGIISIVKGKYDAAISYFGNACEFNAALAKVLNKNYEGATQTIGCVKSEDANVFYLKAIIGARTENSDMVFNNLRTAVGKDAKLKDYAKKDAEFLKYANDETFKSIIQ